MVAARCARRRAAGGTEAGGPLGRGPDHPRLDDLVVLEFEAGLASFDAPLHAFVHVVPAGGPTKLRTDLVHAGVAVFVKSHPRTRALVPQDLAQSFAEPFVLPRFRAGTVVRPARSPRNEGPRILHVCQVFTRALSLDKASATVQVQVPRLGSRMVTEDDDDD